MSQRLKLVIVIISFGLSVSAGKGVYDLWQRRDIVSLKEAELAQLKKENAQLRASLERMKSSGYVEKIARDKLGLVKEGESVLILPQSGNAAQNTGATTQEEKLWRRWWALFF